MLDGSKERVIYGHHFSVAVSECPSIVTMKTQGGTPAGTGGMEMKGLN
jgi:hypothetical protein